MATMATMAQIKLQGANLAAELEQVGKQIAETRAALEATAGDTRQQAHAEKIAARLLVLETREKSIRAAMEANKREQEQRAALVQTKEYRQAQKRMAELEKQEAQTAQEVRAALDELYKVTLRATQRHEEYRELLQGYTPDLDKIARDQKAMTPEYAYVVEIHQTLLRRQAYERHMQTVYELTTGRVTAAARKRAEAEA